MAIHYTDLTSGKTSDLSGDKKEAFEEALLQQVRKETEQCEDYLEESIRPKITENWEYYNGILPRPNADEPSFTDNSCTATVDHYVAACMDAFTNSDSLEVIPSGVTSPVTLKVINQIMNDVLDNENDRHALYQAFFTDALVSSASAMRPIIREETQIDKQFFTDAEMEVLEMMQIQYEGDDRYTDIEIFVTKIEESTQSVTAQPVTSNSVLSQMNIDGIESSSTVTLYSGYFSLVSKVKTIKIEPVPAENFIINKDARGIQDARIVGHKSMITISELLQMGIDYDKVLEVYERCNEDDAANNIASNARREGIYEYNGDNLDTLDKSQHEVELYELYIKSSAEENVDSDKEISVSKLYQVFYCEEVLLAYQETDEVPYCGSSPIPRPHMFWGDGMVDRTKHIQRAKTGLLRQAFVYNELASKPRFEYMPENIINVRDIFNTRAGAGIAVKQLGSVQPIQMTALTGNSDALLGVLDVMRESGSGISFTGQGMMGDVLKAGASTQSAAMVLSEGQMVQKKIITTLLNNAIVPLIKTIYNMLRENFSTWEVTIDGSKLQVNPNEWPVLESVEIKTPLGTSAKLEQSQKYGNLAQTLATAPDGTELAKLASAQGIRELMIKSYELMDVPDAQYFMNDDSTIQSKDQTAQQLQQMQQQLAQLGQQMQQLTQQNQVLQQTASAMAQKQLELDERKVTIQEQESTAKLQNMADEQNRKDEQTNAELQNMADKQALAERQEDRKDEMVEAEISTGESLFRST